ncbi:MAG: response regulator [Limisphaerales bacterium]
MKPKILTVDDSKTIRLIVAKAFKQFDCDVFEAANGVEGLAVANREKPDIIILDITMPIMDGAETLAKLKSNPDLKNIPVVMLTAEAGRENVLRIAKLGVRDYLVKPFKEDLLVERVGRVIELKAKGESLQRIRRFDDPLALLVVDDKPTIIEQISTGLSDTPWTVNGRSQMGEAVDFCSQHSPDAVVVSLSLPEGSGFNLFQMLRANSKTKNTPIFGMCVKTATEDQARAQQMGFSGVLNKPIDLEDLKAKIARSLKLDTSYKYFQVRSGILAVIIPTHASAATLNEVTQHLRAKVSEAVDSGISKLVLDLSLLKSADINLVKLGLETIQLCQELSLRQRVVASDSVRTECRNYEETKDWSFVGTFEDAAKVLNEPAMATAA